MTDRVGKLLERVAREISVSSHGNLTPLLEARLGPLLRAGQAMRDEFDVHNPQWPDMETNGRLQAAWDTALATLEGRE